MINYNLAEYKDMGVGDFKMMLRRCCTLHKAYLLNMGFEKPQVASIIISEMEDIASEMRATLK